jgi:hypothetical protein
MGSSECEASGRLLAGSLSSAGIPHEPSTALEGVMNTKKNPNGISEGYFSNGMIVMSYNTYSIYDFINL